MTSRLKRAGRSGKVLPNKRLKLTGPAFKGTLRLSANELVPQREVLAPSGARPAA